MVERKRPNADQKRALKAAELQQFVAAVGRTARRNGLDPNDRNVDKKVAKTVRQMHPQELDRLLRDDE